MFREWTHDIDVIPNPALIGTLLKAILNNDTPVMITANLVRAIEKFPHRMSSPNIIT